MPPHVKTIALTFDDGPHPEHTPRLLDVLDEYGIMASFFWLGVCVETAQQYHSKDSFRALT